MEVAWIWEQWWNGEHDKNMLHELSKTKIKF